MKGTIGTATSTLRMWWFCLAICCIASTSAVACIPATERGIFFENVPTDIDAPVIIEATIYDESQVGDVAGNQMIVMNARVDRVIKGALDAKTLKIFVYLGSCTRVGVGQGIVLGELHDDPQRGLMLKAIEAAPLRNWSAEFTRRQEDVWNAVRGSQGTWKP
jgi:hypothetical protein